jgi:hypothetical protein
MKAKHFEISTVTANRMTQPNEEETKETNKPERTMNHMKLN